MIPLIKADLRKLITVRSTYVILAAIVVLIGLFAGYGEGYRAAPDSLKSADMLSGEVISAIGAISVLIALIPLLLFAHEYRYNTIMYTLTAARSRSRVLLAKIIAVTLFVVPVTILAAALSPVLTYAGLTLHGYHLVPQTINVVDLLWRTLFFSWGYAMFALIFVALIRNQVGAIAAFFLIPSTVENLLGLLLKDNVKYLPFTSLESVLGAHPVAGSSPVHAAIIAGGYLLGGWIIAFLTFNRRDAN